MVRVEYPIKLYVSFTARPQEKKKCPLPVTVDGNDVIHCVNKKCKWKKKQKNGSVILPTSNLDVQLPLSERVINQGNKESERTDTCILQ